MIISYRLFIDALKLVNDFICLVAGRERVPKGDGGREKRVLEGSSLTGESNKVVRMVRANRVRRARAGL